MVLDRQLLLLGTDLGFLWYYLFLYMMANSSLRLSQYFCSYSRIHFPVLLYPYSSEEIRQRHLSFRNPLQLGSWRHHTNRRLSTFRQQDSPSDDGKRNSCSNECRKRCSSTHKSCLGHLSPLSTNLCGPGSPYRCGSNFWICRQ